MKQFLSAYATGGGSGELVEKILDGLGNTAEGTLGFLYATDCLSSEIGYIAKQLKLATGVADWVGTVGLGLCGPGIELYDEPAISVMITDLPKHVYSLFNCIATEFPLQLQSTDFDAYRNAVLGVIHGNPMASNFMDLFQLCCSQLPNTFFVGGLSSSNFAHPQIMNSRSDCLLSGVLFDSQVNAVVAHTQGCTPLSEKHTITQCEQNIIQQIDGRPALEVFKEDIGEVLSKDLERVGGYIYAGFPLIGTDVNDYTVRNLVGLDIAEQQIMVGDFVYESQPLVFCRRDGNSARQDLQRMLEDIQARITDTPKGALYYSCLGRGRYQFGDQSEELASIEQALPGVPLTGFFANGEIYRDKLYGYTGVLTVFC